MVSDSTQKAAPIVLEDISSAKLSQINFGELLADWLKVIVDFGIRVILAVAIFYVGRLLARFALRLIGKAMERRRLDPAVRTFLNSLLNITFIIVLVVIAINVLGIAPVSFAALMAGAGVTLGGSFERTITKLCWGDNPFGYSSFSSRGLYRISNGGGVCAESCHLLHHAQHGRQQGDPHPQRTSFE